jgi:glycosyltransferase involved in cell wall biosynthesis
MGYVDHDDLPALHAASSGFVFSSACENAPMTLIEALACGSPIACSDAASMPEICGEAALYFDPYDPADIATALRTLVTSPERRSDLSAAALERASAFSWSRAAEQTLAVFEGVR